MADFPQTMYSGEMSWSLFFSRESDSDFVRFHTGHQHGTSSLSTGQMESHSFEHPGTSKPKFLHPGDKGKFYKGFLKGKPGKQSLVKGDPEWPFKTSRSQKKERKIDLMDESDIMSKFGSQIIKWAGFNTMQNDDIFKEQHMALFKVTTESCAKMLASYKCSIKEAQQEYCYFSIDNLKHPALKSPSVDNAFLSMLKENKLIKSRNSFIELLNPADNELMKVQARLLKAGIPLLMACNAYEIDQKIEGLHSIAQLSNALEKSISLCRKSLVLLGQTYAFVTSCRQEKILNIVGLSEKAPKPTKEHAEEEQGETLIREEKKEINTSSSAGEQPTDLAAEEKCEAPTELPVEERKIPVLKTSEDLKDNPILLAIKERLDILQAGEERQDIPILQAIRERLSIPVLQAIKERLSESGSQAGGEKKIPADQTSTKEAEIPFLEANIKEAAIPFLDAGTKEAAIPFLDAGTKEAAIPFLDAGTKEVGIHFLDTGTEGAEIPFLDAGTKEAEIPVLQTPATEGKEIPVLQAREQRKKYISPKSFLRPPQTPALGSGQIQQFLSVRRGFPYKCTQTGVNLSNLLTFPRSNPNPTVCKANEGHSVAKSKDVKRTMYRSKSLHDKAERSSGPDSQPLQSEHLKAMDTIDHLMHNAVGISKRKLVDKEKPPFWFLFDENSMEYKYYRLKLAQSQKLRKITLEVGIQAKLVKAKPKVELSRGEATSKHRKLKRTSTATQTVLSAVVMLQARRAQVSTKLKPSPSEPAKVKQKPSTAGESLSKGHHRLEKRSRSELSCSSLAKRRKSDRHVSSQVSGSSSSSKALLETDYRSERRSHSGSSGSSRERSSTSKSHQLKKQIRASSRNKAPLSKLSHIKVTSQRGPQLLS
ncbi:uncharacterized protein LOC115097614 [Rhinatrema bivittatum]|uniref:uncharacterized protein LOC115097614 n=1 Tax=Rhinatrema bivittatum TaxID=194408 RepID=UPI00112CC681|nr:uncharacterized protein LOC115097614 [Rhinatrema bivittatum]